MQKLSSILLIDDDPTNNYLNECLLQRLGLAEQLLVAESGPAALDLLARAAPALILLNVNIPAMAGMQFLEQYKARQPRPVVLMLTTSMDSKDLARLDELRLDGLVSKPLTEEKIDYLPQLHFRRSRPGQ